MVGHPPSLNDTQHLPLIDVEHLPMDDSTLSALNPMAQILRRTFQHEKRSSFPLGSELLNYKRPSSTDCLGPTGDDVPCFLIWNGYIRILRHNDYLQRELSAIVLQPGEIFGADHLLHSHPLAYRAIAATPCQVIPLPQVDLACSLERYSCLRAYLRQKVQEQERLIFFKGFTSMRSYASKHLQQQLLPYVSEQYVAAGASLSQSVGDRPAYVWLRSGHIINPVNPRAIPQIGDGWQQGTSPSNEWTAGTDLILYKLMLS